MILTDEKGKPFEKPERENYASDVEFFDAWYAYKDSITKCANDAFDDAFRKAMRESRGR